VKKYFEYGVLIYGEGLRWSLVEFVLLFRLVVLGALGTIKKLKKNSPFA